MPRKSYKNRCSYCVGSHLSDEEFEFVHLCFVMGATAKQAAEWYPENVPGKGRSEKTIRRHYALIGRAMYLRCITFEKKVVPGGNISKVLDELLMSFHAQVIHGADGGKGGGEIEKLLGSAVDAYRRLSEEKNGISDSIREHLGLAMYYSYYEYVLRNERMAQDLRNKYVIALVHRESLKQLKEKPC